MRIWRTLALAFGLALPLTRSAHAQEHHFGFTYESSTLAPGRAQLAPWTTVRAGRTDYYSATDLRLAFDYGIAKKLQGALFWNVSSMAEDLLVPGASQKTRLNDTQFDSFALALKYELSDPVADAFGSALYLEGSLGAVRASVEGRMIVDKQIGSLLLSCNVVGSRAERLELRSQSEWALAFVASAGYFVTPTIVPGLEIRDENQLPSGLARSVLYLGPNLSVIEDGFWVTFAVEPQIRAFKGRTRGRNFDLDQNERLQARLLFGMRL